MRRAVLLALAGCTHAAGPVVADDPLAGLWGVERALGHQTAGALHVAHRGAAWVATIDGNTATLVDEGGWLHADLGNGELRMRPDGEAFWLQGPGDSLDQAYASPLALRPTPDGFAGDVVPLADEIRIYVSIAGATAFVREPGHNFGRHLGTLAVARHGDAVVFTRADGKVALHGTLDARGLHVTFDGTEIALDLTRRDRAHAPGFYPRADQTPYREHAPLAGDGWETASPTSVGLRPAPIGAWVQQILDGVPTGPASPAIHALLIARHGKLVVEEYFAGTTAATPHDTRSAGKSWSSTLAGIFVDRGTLSLATPIAGADPDPRKAKITLAHLLSMSSGLDCDDHDPASPGNEDTMQGQRAERDWYRFTLALAMVRAPGERGVYCTGAINLAGKLIADATHAWLPALWSRELAAPLDLSHYYINLMPDEQGYLGGGTYLRARDFAKLAQVFLAGGVWRDRRIVSADWVARATAAHASLNTPDDYGLGWWRTTYRVAGRDHAAFYASGNGGQLAIAIPDYDAIVVIMAGNYNDRDTWRHYLEDDVPHFALAALAD